VYFFRFEEMWGLNMKKTRLLFIGIFVLLGWGVSFTQVGGKEETSVDKKNRFTGTWVHERDVKFRGKKKKLSLYLVIDAEKETPKVRYQISFGTRVFTSKWDGECDFAIERGVKCKHVSAFRYSDDREKILVKTEIRYGGTLKHQTSESEGYYFVDEDGRSLIFRVTRFASGGKEMPIPTDIVYQRISESTEWKDYYSSD